MVFSKHLSAEHTANGKADTVIVVVNVDPHSVRETTVHLDLKRAGIDGSNFEVHDLLTDQKFNWTVDNYVRLDPRETPAHILHVTKVS
ncbi:MAG: hypothetical protein RLZZ340_670 [Actinomycetota bacterium]